MPASPTRGPAPRGHDAFSGARGCVPCPAGAARARLRVPEAFRGAGNCATSHGGGAPGHRPGGAIPVVPGPPAAGGLVAQFPAPLKRRAPSTAKSPAAGRAQKAGSATRKSTPRAGWALNKRAAQRKGTRGRPRPKQTGAVRREGTRGRPRPQKRRSRPGRGTPWGGAPRPRRDQAGQAMGSGSLSPEPSSKETGTASCVRSSITDTRTAGTPALSTVANRSRAKSTLTGRAS